MRVSAQMVAEIGRVVNFSMITSWPGGQLLDYQKQHEAPTFLYASHHRPIFYQAHRSCNHYI
jgi:hypothetical protein